MFNQTSFHGKTANGVDIEQTFLMASRKNQRTLFVVANRGTAHVFEQRDKTTAPALMFTLENTQDRRPLASPETRGRSNESTQPGARSSPERTIISDEAVNDFCRTLIKQLQKVGQSADSIVLVASPHLLGVLRQHVKKQPLGSKVLTDYAKDLANMHPKHLSRRLQSLMES